MNDEMLRVDVFRGKFVQAIPLGDEPLCVAYFDGRPLRLLEVKSLTNSFLHQLAEFRRRWRQKFDRLHMKIAKAATYLTEVGYLMRQGDDFRRREANKALESMASLLSLVGIFDDGPVGEIFCNLVEEGEEIVRARRQ